MKWIELMNELKRFPELSIGCEAVVTVEDSQKEQRLFKINEFAPKGYGSGDDDGFKDKSRYYLDCWAFDAKNVEIYEDCDALTWEDVLNELEDMPLHFQKEDAVITYQSY